MAFNINPLPWSGLENPFGMIPGPIGAINPTPASFTAIGAPSQVGMPNPFADLSAVWKDFPANQNAASALVGSQMRGELSPETQAGIQDASARFGITSGMPGGGIARNRTARDLGRSTEDLQQRGLTNYEKLLRAISDTQTVNPALQAQIGQFNAGAQNQVNAQNAGFANQFALANQGNQQTYDLANLNTARYNAENAARPSPEAEFMKQFELWKQGQDYGRGPMGGAPITSYTGPALSSPAGAVSFGRPGEYVFDADGRASFNPSYNAGTAPPNQRGLGYETITPTGGYTATLPSTTGTYTDAELNMLQGLTNEDIQNRVWQNPAGFNYFGAGQPSANLWDLGTTPDTVQNSMPGLLPVGGYDPWQDYIDATGG